MWTECGCIKWEFHPIGAAETPPAALIDDVQRSQGICSVSARGDASVTVSNWSALHVMENVHYNVMEDVYYSVMGNLHYNVLENENPSRHPRIPFEGNPFPDSLIRGRLFP